jgi:alpha-tubulin suppressor-like RCC1 family protein
VRGFSVYGFGEQWTGALSRGTRGLTAEEAPELSYEEIRRFGERQNLVPLTYDGDGDGKKWKCAAASAGWGHTAVVIEDGLDDDDDDGGAAAAAVRRRLLVCGRPHDFQTLMRLRRLPSSIRSFCVRYSTPSSSSPSSGGSLSPSVLQRVATYMAGENEVTFHEDECRRYGNVPSLLEIELPDGEVPALEGERLDDKAHESHASSGRSSSSFHSRFQNTLATSAGLTAIVSTTGTLYTFGLNHRGQCGTGSFSPNVWSPSRVAGLASTRFVLDHGAEDLVGDDMFRKFGEQQNPIVSVALGLQHGVALDSDGQVFCWGKGERGQLGQGRRTVRDDGDDGDDREGDDASVSEGEEAPTENRTFEYALHVPNFHDPYASASTSPFDVYVPLLSEDDSKVRSIAAGMNFSMAVTRSNLPYIWGKNVHLNPSYSASGINLRTKPVLDSTYPRYIPGLPEELSIVRIACGSHHSAMLLEDGSIWAVGVATDRAVPLWDEAVEVLASGIVDMSELISFTAGFDRTIVVSGTDNGRRQVIEVQLWSNEELRQQGAVRPSWVDWLESEKGHEKVCSIHRGWMHTIVRTE